MKKSFSVSYKFKLLVYLTLFMVLTCCSLIYFAIRDTKSTAIDIFSERGISILQQANSKIDTERFKELSKSLDKNNPYFDELYNAFHLIKENSDCKYLYIMRQVAGTNFVYVVDGTDQSDDNYSEIGNVEDISDYGNAPFECIKQKKFINSGLEKQEEWGWMISTYAPILDKTNTVLGFIGVDFQAENLKQHLAVSTKRLTIIGSAISLICILLMVILILNFFGSVDSVINAMKNISEGSKELTVRLDVPKSKELGSLCQSCNNVIENMQSTMQTVSDSVTSVNSNSTKIVEQTRKLVTLIDNVNGNISDVKSKADSQQNLITNLESNTNDLTTSIQTLNEKIKEQERSVNNSIEAVKMIIESISGTDSQINKISNEYQTIVEETKDNGKKQNAMTERIKFIAEQAENLSIANAVITGIASKTNLLAMNAAIEASHAGEAGKGFSVVAGEIRALAENSANQTQNITNLVNEIDEAVKLIVSASDDSEKAFSSLGHKIETLSHSMTSIKDNMNKQTENATNITTMLELLQNSTSSISSASNTINQRTQDVVKGINTMKFSIKRINQSSESAQTLLTDMNNFAQETNNSSENNKNAVDNINNLVGSYKF